MPLGLPVSTIFQNLVLSTISFHNTNRMDDTTPYGIGPVGKQEDFHRDAVVLMRELEGFAGEMRLAPFGFGDFANVGVDLVRIMEIQLAQTHHDGDQNGKDPDQPEI